MAFANGSTGTVLAKTLTTKAIINHCVTSTHVLHARTNPAAIGSYCLNVRHLFVFFFVFYMQVWKLAFTIIVP